jgi:hypothetical protein
MLVINKYAMGEPNSIDRQLTLITKTNYVNRL